MLKICHVITRFILGGAQENTLASVIGLAKRGHDVTLISGPSRGAEGNLLVQKNLHNSNLPFKFIELPQLVREINPIYDYIAYKKLAAKFEKEKYDIIHTHSSKAGVIGRFAAAKVREKNISKVVHTIHGLAFDKYQPFWKNKIYIAAEKFCAKKSDKIISVCDTMTKQALAEGIGQPDLYTTIYSGFDIEKFTAAKKQKSQARKTLAISDDTIVILSIGRLFYMKGTEEFITVMENISDKENFKIKGILIGDGKLRAQLEKRVKNNIPGNKVIFTGLLPPDEIPKWLAAADFVIHASLREGLARIIPQALAAGKPVISYDIGGAKEIIQNGKNGFIVQAGDINSLIEKTKTLIENRELLKNLTDNAEQTDLTDFKKEIMVDKLENLYKKLQAI